MKIVVLLICILTCDVEKTNSTGYVLMRRRLLGQLAERHRRRRRQVSQ